MQVFAHTPSFKRASLAAAVAVGCAAAVSAHAADATGEQLKAVKLYGNVSIAEDDIQAWGPWEQIEPPQAGPMSSLRNLAATREVYRPLASLVTSPLVPPTSPADFACEGGGICGFGVKYTLGYPPETPPSMETGSPVRPQGYATVLASTSLQEVTLKALGTEVDQAGLPAQIALKTSSVTDGTTTIYSPFVSQPMGWGYGYYLHQPTQTALASDADLNKMQDGEIYDYFMGPDADMRGCEGDPCFSANEQYAQFWVGKTSTAEQVSAAAAKYGTRLAVYVGQERGWTVGAAAGYPAMYGKVSIEVDFNKKTFSYKSSMNGGYKASGNLTSIGYMANSFSSGVSGVLKGYFVGSEAQSTVGGARLSMEGTQVDSIHVTVSADRK
jgi:hypothetical protein